ncbi:MAG: DNA polymerase I [Candidatus Omnitrophica bacterium]|nr:DNA polymerase I [Candidatus Omnitrophota bacterium]
MTQTTAKGESPRAQSPQNKRSGRLFLIDGHSLCYRAYYAIASLSNSKGEPTNAIYGFVVMLLKLIRDSKPDHLAICFDRPEPTFRHKKYDQYKAHRKPMPEDLIQQMEPIKEFCRVSRFAIYEKPGYEADDVIGTLASKGAEQGYEVFIVTGDKDAMQLVTDRIKILNPHKEGMIIDADGVRKRYDGLGPEKVIEIMALMGDASDNIPGVPGIGEKTALKLIHQFDSVDGLIKNVSKVTSKSQQALLREHEDKLRLSRELVTIDTDVPLDYGWDNMTLQGPDEPKLIELLKRYEFRGLLKDHERTQPQVLEDRRYESIQRETDLRTMIDILSRKEAFSFDTETTSADPMKAHLVGVSFSFEPLQAYYIPVSSVHHAGKGFPVEKVLEVLKPILENPKRKKYGQNIKYDWIVLKRHGITMQGVAFDTMIASYLVNPLKLNHNLDDISLEHLGIRKISTESLIGSGQKQITMDQVPVEKVSEYACEDADCVFRLVPLLQNKIEALELKALLVDLELPLAEVLAKMEMNGVSLDVPFLQKLSEECGCDLEKLTLEIHKEAGEAFNINSTKQLAEVLFVKLKMPVVRKTKTGFSTDVSVLEKLSESYELPKKLLEYREKNKLKSTYLDALQTIINPATGFVHTSYHQTTTVTGRLSSSDPNLQNIPIKTEAGRLIRKAFIPRRDGEKRLILSADYSQIELRILAHLSGDPNLVKAFAEDRDIHKFTATLLYGVRDEEVTREMRNLAKTINFSIIYGKTAYGLSQDLNLSIPEADAFIQNYFKRYGKVKSYLEGQLEIARKQGYLTTILGRRSYFPDLNSKNGQLRQFAERAAINAPIQGSAADLIKLAMIAVQKEIEKENLQSLMIMQVHDELVFDVLEKELPKLEKMVRSRMESAFPLNVPLKVDVFTGSSWYKN